MQITVKVTVILSPGEDASAARVIAILKDLAVDSTQGDAEGRRWAQFSGVTDEHGLSAIVSHIQK